MGVCTGRVDRRDVMEINPELDRCSACSWGYAFLHRLHCWNPGSAQPYQVTARNSVVTSEIPVRQEIPIPY